MRARTVAASSSLPSCVDHSLAPIVYIAVSLSPPAQGSDDIITPDFNKSVCMQIHNVQYVTYYPIEKMKVYKQVSV